MAIAPPCQTAVLTFLCEVWRHTDARQRRRVVAPGVLSPYGTSLSSRRYRYSASGAVCAVVDLGAVIHVEDVHNLRGFLDAVDDPVGPPAGSVEPARGPNSGLPTRRGLSASAASQNSRTGPCSHRFRGDGPRSPAARRAGTGSIPLGRFAVSGRWHGAGPDPADGGQISTGLATAQRGQALRDTCDGVTVAEDFQGHLQALEIGHGDSRTASASPLRVKVIRSCCRRTRLASS